MPGYILDTNVWIAFNFEGHSHNARSIAFIDACTAECPALFSRAVETSTLRLMSNPSVCLAYNSPPMTNQQALTVLNDWRSHDHIIGKLIAERLFGFLRGWHSRVAENLCK